MQKEKTIEIYGDHTYALCITSLLTADAKVRLQVFTVGFGCGDPGSRRWPV